MRNLMNSDQSYTGLVQKYIGSAFDIVRAVANELGGIEKINELIEKGDWDTLMQMLPNIEELLKNFDLFHNTYYGPRDTVPLERPDGSQIQPGDMYYDTARGGLYVREGTEWVPVGGFGNQLEVHEISAQDVANTTFVRLRLKNTFTPGTHNLLVFVNATYQYPVTTSTPNGSYREGADGSYIEFSAGDLREGDVVTCLVGGVVSTTEHVVSLSTATYRVPAQGTKVVEIPDGLSYLPNMNNLEVFVDGLRQQLILDYQETDSRHVTFVRPLHDGQQVVFKVGTILSSNYADSPDTRITTMATVGEFYIRGPALRKDYLVYVMGYHTVHDGGGGFFIYDPMTSKEDANGGTIIDTSVPLDVQGTGLGQGCWVRMYANWVEPQFFGIDDPVVANLTRLGHGREGDTVEVVGYHEAGDGGEGMFYWDPQMPKNNHDGGTIIDPLKKFPENWGNSVQLREWYNPATTGILRAGCWVRGDRERASFCWFGAKGDGTSDNSGVLAGIGLAIESGHVTSLEIPPGIYQCSGAPSLKVRQLPRALRIWGYGQASRLHFTGAANQHSIRFQDCANIQVTDVAFSDDRVGANTALQLENCSQVTIENCTFHGFRGASVHVCENKDTGSQTACNDLRVAGCRFEMCGAEASTLRILPLAPSANLQIESNEFLQCGAANEVVIEAGMAMRNARVLNNYIQSCAGTSVRVQAYETVFVNANTIRDYGEHAIALDVSAHPNYQAARFEHCEIRGNFIEANGAKWGILVTGDALNNETITLDGNTFLHGGAIRISTMAPIKHLQIVRNRISDPNDTLTCLLIDQPSGGNAPQAPHVADNQFINWNPARLNELVHVVGVDRLTLYNNYFRGGGHHDLVLENSGFAEVLNNIFNESNLSQQTPHSCIHIDDASTALYYLRNNQVVKGAQGDPQNFLSVNGTARVIATGNILAANGMQVTESAGVRWAGPQNQPAIQYAGARHFYGTNMPQAGDGTFQVGDIIWHTQPATGNYIGWVCVAQGDPGTWTTFGAIT